MTTIDVYTDKNEPAGYSVSKKEAHAKGLWHRVFTCLVVNTDNQTIYLQKKTPGRYIFDRPDYLDITVGGHYEAGEKIEDGIREIEEEIGIKVSFEQLVPLGQRQTSVTLDKHYNNNEFQHIFLLPTKNTITEFKHNTNEVCGLVEIPVLDGINLITGSIDQLTVSSSFQDTSGAQCKDVKLITVRREDFVPSYLKTDEFMLRLLIAAQRYLEGQDPKLIYW